MQFFAQVFQKFAAGIGRVEASVNIQFRKLGLNGVGDLPTFMELSDIRIAFRFH